MSIHSLSLLTWVSKRNKRPLHLSTGTPTSCLLTAANLLLVLCPWLYSFIHSTKVCFYSPWNSTEQCQQHRAWAVSTHLFPDWHLHYVLHHIGSQEIVCGVRWWLCVCVCVCVCMCVCVCVCETSRGMWVLMWVPADLLWKFICVHLCACTCVYRHWQCVFTRCMYQ